MKALPRPALVAACCLALAWRATAAAPDTNAASAVPPHADQDKSLAEATDMKALLKRARDAINSARKAEELDPVLFDMQKYQNNGFQGFGMGATVAPENQQLLQQIFSAVEFTKQWQNYLSHVNSGNTQQARNDLQMLSMNNFGPSLIARSRILALMSGEETFGAAGNAPATAAAVPEAQKIIDGIATLDDLKTALGKLNDLAQQDSLAREYAQHLQPMEEVYEDLKNGLPTSVNVDFMGGLTGAGVSAKANSLLLKFVLQHYFESYKGAPPADDETAAAYATRVRNDALAGQDWALLKKALEVHAWFFRNVAVGAVPDNDAAGLDKMITGLNQQKAGQYGLAVESFQNALNSGSLYVPAQFIGAQLDAIKRDHPSDYDSGMEAFLTPQAPAQPVYFQQGANPSYNAAANAIRRRRANAYPTTTSGMNSPTLAFPGTKPTPIPESAAPAPGTNAAPASAKPQ
jgi:hypothetical protein